MCVTAARSIVTRSLLALACLGAVALPLPAAAAEADAAKGKGHYAICQTCHGTKAEGQQAFHAPRLAGQHAWYVARQLESFRGGVRGYHPQDVYGQQMRGMAGTLADQGAVNDVSAYVATLAAPRPARSVQGGDAQRGKALFGICATCHGQAAQGSEPQGAPRLAGQHDWYLVKQLDDFRAGYRGAQSDDARGAAMAAMANTLPDRQAVLDVVTYINTLE